MTKEQAVRLAYLFYRTHGKTIFVLSGRSRIETDGSIVSSEKILVEFIHEWATALTDAGGEE